MSARPTVTVQGVQGVSVPLPNVFLTPIRPDLTHITYTNVRKNTRQAYAVSTKAGHQHSAESWGTGRAVSRIPRVAGGGTHRAGQGAFGNMCRGGRMFAPTKVWRRWHRHVNIAQKRYATASCIAASGVVPLVMSRGHRIEDIAEIPLVVDGSRLNFCKTKEAVKLLKELKCGEELSKVSVSHRVRAGQGKSRNRRYTQKKGLLLVYSKPGPFVRAFRNIPGVEIVRVENLSVLDLAPGATMGRFVLWTRDAFEALDGLWSSKRNYKAPTAKMSNPDLRAILSSPAVKAVLRERRTNKPLHNTRIHHNPLRNVSARVKLNPAYPAIRRRNLKRQANDKKTKALRVAKGKRESQKQLKHRQTHLKGYVAKVQENTHRFEPKITKKNAPKDE